MKIRKLILATITTIVMLSCNKKADNSQIDIINTDFVKVFEGQIENKYDIQMKLISNNGNINGNYFYKKTGEEIEIKGFINNLGKISINEFDKKGNQTGVFNGEMLNENKIQGTWSKPNGSNPMPFFLIASNTSNETNSQDLNSSKYKTAGKKIEFNDNILNDIKKYYQEQSEIGKDYNGRKTKLEVESDDSSYSLTYRHIPDEEESDDYFLATVYIPTNEKAGLIYGDLNNDNLLDLIVSTSWEGAGTSVHGCSYFVYLNKNNALELTDIVDADSFLQCYSNGHIGNEKIENGYFIIYSNCYADNDANCCPSLKHLTKMKLSKNKLIFSSQQKIK